MTSCASLCILCIGLDGSTLPGVSLDFEQYDETEYELSDGEGCDGVVIVRK